MSLESSRWELADGTWICELHPWAQQDVVDKAEPGLGREGGRKGWCSARAVPEDPAPRGRWKEIRFVGSSWLETSLWLPFLLHF